MITEVGTEQYLISTAVICRQIGWTSRGKARDDERLQATADLAWDLSTGSDEGWKRWVDECGLLATDEDRELAALALGWARSHHPFADDEYLCNLGIATRYETVKGVTAGLVASAIAAYQRENENEDEVRAASKLTYVGTVDTRVKFTDLACVVLKTTEGWYGPKTFCRFEDLDGNVLIWWATGRPDWLEVDGVYDIVGRVKAHDEYRGIPQTVVTRVRAAKGGE